MNICLSFDVFSELWFKCHILDQELKNPHLLISCLFTSFGVCILEQYSLFIFLVRSFISNLRILISFLLSLSLSLGSMEKNENREKHPRKSNEYYTTCLAYIWWILRLLLFSVNNAMVVVRPSFLGSSSLLSSF